MYRKFYRLALVLVLLSLVACTTRPSEEEMAKKPKIYCSFFPIYDLTQSIAGYDFNVQSFMPLEMEAHHWEPSAKDIKDLSEADLLIINGADMEEWVPKVKKALPDLKILDLSEGLDLIKVEGHDEEICPICGHAHHHGAPDPHSFLSLTNAIQYVDKIKTALGAIQEDKKPDLDQRAQALTQDMEKLLTKYQGVFADKKNKTFIVPHEAFAYFSRDFGLTQYPLQGLTSTEEPDLKTIQKAIKTCQDLGIKTIFYEYGGPSKGAEAIAKELKIGTAPLATMEMKPEKDLHYLDLMKLNLENIAKSLDQ